MADGGFTIHLNERDYRRAMEVIGELQAVERTPLMRKAFNDAMTPMVAQGKANISARNTQGEGQLKRSITKKAYPSKLYAIAGGQRKGVYKGNHLHLVDRGTKQRFKRDGRSTGAMYKGKPSTKWGGRTYTPHGKPRAWTDAWATTKFQVARALLKGLEDAARKIWR